MRVILQDEETDLIEETPLDHVALLRELQEEMSEASRKMEYERAALLRDQIEALKKGEPLKQISRPYKKRGKPTEKMVTKNTKKPKKKSFNS